MFVPGLVHSKHTSDQTASAWCTISPLGGSDINTRETETSSMQIKSPICGAHKSTRPSYQVPKIPSFIVRGKATHG